MLHNPTRGQFLLPNARRYGSFVDEWRAIYERFGVPAEIGLAQAIIESGLNGTRRSEARAIGFCQWLESNWRHLDRVSPHVIESRNQTTQAAYCAAYLTILATKYGSFIPALSDHHSGGTNTGRTLINGERLSGEDVRERYFLGSQLARELRQISLYGYRELYRTYGPRSYYYSEMVFGNMATVAAITASTPQAKIYAMRAPRAIALSEVTRRTRLSVDEVQRFNPALRTRVPAGATLYLPSYVADFGRDVSFFAFSYPWWRFVLGFFFAVLILSLVVAAVAPAAVDVRRDVAFVALGEGRDERCASGRAFRVLEEVRGEALVVAADQVTGDALCAQPLAQLLQLRRELPEPTRGTAGRRAGRTVHEAFCDAANHSLMYSIAVVVGVPGPKSLPIPRSSSARTSSSGMIPPPVRRIWSPPASRSSSCTRGKSVMCAPESTDIATTSTSS